MRQTLIESIRQLETLLLEKSPLQVRQAFRSKQINSWESYCEARGLHEWVKQDPQLRYQLLSKVLSYPMTIANMQHHFFDSSRNNYRIHLLIAGARAEADLPHIYWRELSMVTENSFHLKFVGPQVRPRATSGKSYPHEITESKNKEKLSEIDNRFSAIVMFNSGIGHPVESVSWSESIDVIRKSKLPILFSSFNETDLIRDLAQLKTLDIKVSQVEHQNPFRSLWEEHYQSDSLFVNRSTFVGHGV